MVSRSLPRCNKIEELLTAFSWQVSYRVCLNFRMYGLSETGTQTVATTQELRRGDVLPSSNHSYRILLVHTTKSREVKLPQLRF